MDVKPVLTRRPSGQLWRDQQPARSVDQGDCPQTRADAIAVLMEFTVASAVAATALPVATRKATNKRLAIAINYERRRIMLPPLFG
jgi:hypothetical protein